jgi:phosphoribosylaminoimidazole-succinocarboxamide synthase
MTKITKKALLYEGKAKKVYATDDPGLVIQEFKNDATAFDGVKHDQIKGKGVANAQIAGILMGYLNNKGIPTHFREMLSENFMLVWLLKMLKAEFVVRNISAGSIAKKLGLPEGEVFKRPILEYYYKDDALHDPMVNRNHLLILGWVEEKTLEECEHLALEINSLLESFFKRCHLRLVDFKLEFGLKDGKVYLGDEISPDTCRLWDLTSNEKLDKDRFRRDLGGVEEMYQEVLRRVQGAIK